MPCLRINLFGSSRIRAFNVRSTIELLLHYRWPTTTTSVLDRGGGAHFDQIRFDFWHFLPTIRQFATTNPQPVDHDQHHPMRFHCIENACWCQLPFIVAFGVRATSIMILEACEGWNGSIFLLTGPFSSFLLSRIEEREGKGQNAIIARFIQGTVTWDNRTNPSYVGYMVFLLSVVFDTVLYYTVGRT